MTVQKFCSNLALGLLTVAVLSSTPMGMFGLSVAHAQDAQALNDRIERLERDIRTLNQQIARMPGASTAPASDGAGASSANAPQFTEGEGALSRVMVRLGALESEVRAATGQAESLSYGIQQLNQRLDKLLVDLDYRLARLEGTNPGSFSDQSAISGVPASPPVVREGALAPVAPTGGPTGGPAPTNGEQKGRMLKDGTYQPATNESTGTLGTVSQAKVDALAPPAEDGSAPEAPPSAQPAADSVATATAGTAEERYRLAFDLTRQARYEEAEVAFKAFLASDGDNPLADNARYWLAETYYVRKRYMESAQAFFEAYQKAPEGPKAADSLLKLGMSMAGLDKPTEACATFGKLRKEFTPMKANIEQALNRETKRLACK